MTRRPNITRETLDSAPSEPAPPIKVNKRGGGRPPRARKFPHPGADTIPTAPMTKASYQRMFDADASYANLRWQAKLAYTTDINQCTIADVAKMKQFEGVGLEQLRKWCWVDGWQDERVRFLADLQKRMELAIADEVTRQRLSYLRAIRPAVESALKKFVGHPFEPFQKEPEPEPGKGEADAKAKAKQGKKPPVCKVCGRWELGHDDPFFGLEGDRVVNSLVKLVELDLTLSEVVARAVSGSTTDRKGQDGTDGNPPLAASVTSEEARLAAHAILRKRRAAILAPPDGEGGSPVDPAASPSDVDD